MRLPFAPQEKSFRNVVRHGIIAKFREQRREVIEDAVEKTVDIDSFRTLTWHTGHCRSAAAVKKMKPASTRGRLSDTARFRYLHEPSCYTHSPLLEAPQLAVFTTLFTASTEEGMRTDNNEMYRVFMCAASNHAKEIYHVVDENDFKTFIYRVGWYELRPAVVDVLLQRARKAAGTADLNYRAFVAAFLLLSSMAEPESQEKRGVGMYKNFQTILNGILLPYTLRKVDDRVTYDARGNKEVQDVISVYWQPLQKMFAKFCGRRTGEHSARLKTMLLELMQLEGWLAFAEDAGLNSSLIRSELVAIAKCAQTSDKEHIINFSVVQDRAFLGRVCLDLHEFINALFRASQCVYSHARGWRPVHKFHSLLQHLCTHHTLLSLRNFALPGPSIIRAISPGISSVDGGSAFHITATNLCHERGVYVRFGGIDAIHLDVKDGSVDGTIPAFPKTLRWKSVDMQRAAAMEAWEREVLHRRAAGEVNNFASPPLGSPEYYGVRIEVEVEMLHNGAAELTPTAHYSVEVSLSNDGHTFASCHTPVEVVYTETLTKVLIPTDVVARLFDLFRGYCQHNDVYNNTLLTKDKWARLRRDCCIVEPEHAIYDHERIRPRRIPPSYVRTPNPDPEHKIRTMLATWEQHPACGRLLRLERRMSLAAQGLAPCVPVGQRLADLQQLCTSEPMHADADPEGVDASTVFDRRALLRNNHGIAANTVKFPEFVRILAKICVDVKGTTDCRPFLDRIIRLSKTTLSRTRSKRTYTIAANKGTADVVHSLAERPMRRFDVLEGSLVLGVLGEGGGWVDRGGRKHPHSLISWASACSARACVLARLEGIFAIPDLPSFEGLLQRLLQAGFLLAPSSAVVKDGCARCYEVTVTKPVHSSEETPPHAATFCANTASTIAAHLWDHPGTLCTLWWQAAEGEVAHPEATMLVYGKDPTQHFHPLFQAFVATRTLRALREELARRGYCLSLLSFARGAV